MTDTMIRIPDPTGHADGWITQGELAGLRARVAELERNAAEEVDEFNAGYTAAFADADPTQAEIAWSADHERCYDVFEIGYVWGRHHKYGSAPAGGDGEGDES